MAGQTKRRNVKLFTLHKHTFIIITTSPFDCFSSQLGWPGTVEHRSAKQERWRDEQHQKLSTNGQTGGQGSPGLCWRTRHPKMVIFKHSNTTCTDTHTPNDTYNTETKWLWAQKWLLKECFGFNTSSALLDASVALCILPQIKQNSHSQ